MKQIVMHCGIHSVVIVGFLFTILGHLPLLSFHLQQHLLQVPVITPHHLQPLQPLLLDPQLAQLVHLHPYLQLQLQEPRLHCHFLQVEVLRSLELDLALAIRLLLHRQAAKQPPIEPVSVSCAA